MKLWQQFRRHQLVSEFLLLCLVSLRYFFFLASCRVSLLCPSLLPAGLFRHFPSSASSVVPVELAPTFTCQLLGFSAIYFLATREFSPPFPCYLLVLSAISLHATCWVSAIS
jgi:hypothetical protein